MTAAQEVIVTITCNHEHHPQACANYYSVIHYGGPSHSGGLLFDGSSLNKFACTESHFPARINAKATDRWHRSHKNTQWKSFVTPSVLNIKKNTMEAINCEADEYPVS
jgi:hypothetical protein